MNANAQARPETSPDPAAEYAAVRATTESLCRPLCTEDYVVQAMPDVSPAKWHLAHTTWYFETFLLVPFLPGYRAADPAYGELFNSYYQSVGRPWPRAERGILSRPTVDEVFAYRRRVDGAMQELLSREDVSGDVTARTTLGLHHEQQHQELLLMDLKYNLFRNPLRPAYREDLPAPRRADGAAAAGPSFIAFPGGLEEIGTDGPEFAFDNESPRHQTWIAPYRLAHRPVTNREFLAFVEDGQYQRPDMWLSDGWTTLQREGWRGPLYWEALDGNWCEFTLGGRRPLVLDAPVAHVSYYEADAYARWARKRLPTEAEWERAAAAAPESHGDNFLEAGLLQPAPTASGSGAPADLLGNVWELTRSAYAPYPGFRPLSGSLGEYNGKFMSGQVVLRGGSCFTPRTHIRMTYRNFFYPHQRWNTQGFRLADDGE